MEDVRRSWRALTPAMKTTVVSLFCTKPTLHLLFVDDDVLHVDVSLLPRTATLKL